MLINTTKPKRIAVTPSVVTMFIMCIAWIALSGCQSSGSKMSVGADSDKAPKVLGIFPAPPDKPGAQLWAENCNRCHIAPPPERFSDAQWNIVVHHMRSRADLTGEEQRKITEFLQASN